MGNLANQNPWPINLIIMAGGKGTRLKSITENKHKSLLEIAGKPIIVHLIEHLISFGFCKIYLSVGHLSTQISDFLGEGTELGISINYISETTPMGSIGAISLKKDWEHEYFMVINGDIFTNFNVNEFIATFFEKKVDMAILTFLNNVEIPWGVLNTNSDGVVTHLVEKPTYEINISTGIYLFSHHILKLFPSSGPLEGWQLIQSALANEYKVISIPLTDGFWIDIGTTETLLKAQQMPSLANVR